MLRFVSAIVLLAAAASAFADDDGDYSLFEIRSRLLIARMSGSVSSGESDTGSSVRGVRRTLRSDLGLRWAPAAELRIRFNMDDNDALEARGFFLRGRGSETQGEDFTFDEGMFAAGSNVTSELTMGQLDLGYSRKLFTLAGIAFRAGVGVEYWDAKMDMEKTTLPLGTSESEGMRNLIPFVAAEASMPLGRNFFLEGGVRWGPLGTGRVFPEPARVRFLEGSVSAAWRPWTWLSIGVTTDFLYSHGYFKGEEPSGRNGEDIFDLNWIAAGLLVEVRF